MKRIRCLVVLMGFLKSSLLLSAQDSATFKLPPYEKFVLQNGLAVYLMEQRDVPLINVSLILPAGAVYDGAKSGLATLTASMLMAGTKTKTKQVVEEELDFAGAQVYTYASKESAGLSAKFAAKDGTKVLALVREILLTPRFDAKEFDKEKKLMLAQLEQDKESPQHVIGDYFDQAVYGAHVYANPAGGRAASVAKLTLQDVQGFYKSYYMPNGAALAIVGDFSMSAMRERLMALFSTWPKKTNVMKTTSSPVASAATTQVLLVNKDDATETTFMIGGPGVPRNNPDYVAMEVVNTAFGGRFTSWLNDELRVNTGLTYGARSSFSRLKSGGTFAISTFTATKNTEAALDKALEVLRKLHTTGIDEKTLTSAKNYVKGGFPPRYETSGQLANLLTQMFWYGFDESFINNFQQSVDELTAARAKEIVAKYFPNDKLQFVLVGKSEAIKKTAAKYGAVTEVQLKSDAAKSF